MEKFSNLNENVKKYAGNQILRNKINDIIEETLSVKVDGEVNEDVSIAGKEELVESLNKFITSKIIKTKIDEINNFKVTPALQEKEVTEILVKKKVNFDAYNENGMGKIIDQYYDNDWIYIVEKNDINYPVKREQISKIYETGEWTGDEDQQAWLEDLKSKVEMIEEETEGKLKLESVKGHDAYLGPYANVNVEGKSYKIWTTEYEGVLWIDNFVVDNTSNESLSPGYQGTIDEIVDVINTYIDAEEIGLMENSKNNNENNEEIQ